MALGGSGGMVAGALSSLVYGRPFFRYTIGTSGSVCIALGCFSAIQETVRFLRCDDSMVNSWIAGTGAGYLITTAHQGRRKGAIAGVLWGGVALGVHHMSETYRPGNMLKRRLVALDLLDGSDLKGEADSSKRDIEDNDASHGSGWLGINWWVFSPIQKMTHEELAEYRRKKKEEEEEHKIRVMAKRNAAARAGWFDISDKDR